MNGHFLNVKVFNPYAPSNQKTPLSACYRSHENEKKRKYDQRIREIEHASFTPLILSCTGGLEPQATTSYKRLASLLSAKWNQAYSLTIMWLRCRLAYSLLRSSVMCILTLAIICLLHNLLLTWCQGKPFYLHNR